jgi:integrase
VADEWLATQTTDYKYKADVVRKFLLPFFHELRLITDISTLNDDLIADYKVWRLNFWQGGVAGPSIQTSSKQAEHFGEPRATTLNRENPTLRQILKFASKKGYFGARLIPEVPMEAWKPNPRPAFLGGDFDKLANTVAVWIAEADTDLVRWRRQLLWDWIWVARHTGIRLPHEADALTWGDVRLDTRLFHIPEDTKTGKRDVPLNDMALARLKDMRARRITYAKTSNQKFLETEPLFLMVDGSSPGDLGKLFNQLIEKCQFPARSDGDAYSPYSLRHTFATFALA